jgi:2-keto-4-pentenoate hydratase/2-oxohepta-3-ene-1,7-dioic acid hydratase in catechol pathway
VRLATIRVPSGERAGPRLTRAVKADGDLLVDLGAADLGEFLADTTADLLFDPVALVESISVVTRLNPGDIIATGTPGGVGSARTPPRLLVGGETVTASVEGIGETVNKVVKEAAR